MKYIVEVREPVPSNLDEIASKVAASFRISDEKALVLLRRAPGAMTKAVSEREADVVAGIFERAGLQVVKRPVEEPPARPAPAAPDATKAADGGEGVAAGEGAAARQADARDDAEAERGAGAPASDASLDEVGEEEPPAGAGALDEPLYGGGAERDAQGEAYPEGPVSAGSDVWDRPLQDDGERPVDAFSRREGFEEEGELDWGAGAPSDEGAPLEAEELPPEEGIELEEDTGPRAGADDAGERGDLSPGARARQAWAEEAAAGSAAGMGGDEAGHEAAEVGAAAAATGSAGDLGRSSRTPEMTRASQTPETVRRSQTPETMKSTMTRAPADKLHRGGLRRRVALSSILPALLTLVVMAVAMLVTVLPLLRSQQLARATDAARAEATTLEAMTGGLPLASQTLSTALVDLARGSKAAMGGDGVRLMVVTDATGTPLAGWYGPALTPAALPPAVRQQVAGRALEAVAGGANTQESFGQSLQRSWSSLLAMVGLGSASDVVVAAPVTSAGQAIGAVVVGVRPVSADALVGNAFLTTVLVGLVPVLIAILVAMGLTRGLRSQITYLLVSADRISHGDFEEPVALDSRDELGQLARAIERMRVSLQEGLERLRHRR